MAKEFVNQINQARQESDWDKVVLLTSEVLEQEPGEAFCLRNLADAFEETEQIESALGPWKALVDQHHQVTPYARKLGLELKRQDDPVALHYLDMAMDPAIDARHAHEVEELWLELIDLGEVLPARFFEWSDRLIGRRENELAGDLLLIYAESDGLAPMVRLQALRRAVPCLPERETQLRGMLQDAFQKAYSDRPDIEKILSMADLAAATDLPAAVNSLDRYLKFGEGQFFYHQGWGTGKVISVDPQAERVTIDFAKKKGHILTLEMADKSLTEISPEDLRARWLEDREQVKEMVDSDAVGLVKAGLLALGGKATGKEIKELLLGRPVPEDKWSKWWTAVNKHLKADPFVEVTGTSQKTYTLREKAEAPEEEYLRRFRQTKTLRGKLSVLDEYQTHHKEQVADQVLEQMVEDLVAKAMTSRIDSDVVEAVYRAEQLADRIKVNTEQVDRILEPIALDLTRAVNALEGLKNSQVQAKWFERMETALGEDLSQAYKQLMEDGPDFIRDLVEQHILRVHDEKVFPQLFRSVRTQQQDRAGLFIWFARKAFLDPQQTEVLGMSRPAFLEALVSLHDILDYRARTSKKEVSKDLRAHMSAIRQLLKRSNFGLLRQVLAETDATAARNLLRAVEAAIRLEEKIRREINGYLTAHYPDLVVTEGEDEGVRLPLPTHLLCLQTSLESKRARLRQLSETEIPENTAEIDRARQMGDLSENAEYHAAKERQGVLLSLKGQLEQEIANAVVVPEDDYPVDHIGFGSVSRVQLGSETQVVTLLGPWESDPDSHVLSYESPLGQVLWGQQVGNTTTYTGGAEPVNIEILDIERFIPA